MLSEENQPIQRLGLTTFDTLTGWSSNGTKLSAYTTI